MAKEIGGNIDYMREREERMRHTNESIHERLIAYCVLTIGVLLALSIFQLIYLKRFFVSKKVI